MSRRITLFFLLSVTLFINMILPMDQPAKQPAAVEALVQSFQSLNFQDGDFSFLASETVQNVFNLVKCDYPWEEMMQLGKIRAVCKRWLCLLGDLSAALKYRKIPRLHFAAMKDDAQEIMRLKLEEKCFLREPDSSGFRAAHYALATKKHHALKVLKIGHALNTKRQGIANLTDFIRKDDVESMSIILRACDTSYTEEDVMKLAKNESTVELEKMLLRMMNPIVLLNLLMSIDQQKTEASELFMLYLSFALSSSCENAFFDFMDEGEAITGSFFDNFKLCGANPNLCDEWGRTALARACADPDFEHIVVNLLACKGIDVNRLSKKDGDTFAPLHVAAENECIKIFKALVDNPECNLEIVNNDGQTAFGVAIRYGRDDCVKLLLEKGADTSCKDRYGCTLLHLAALHGRKKSMSLCFPYVKQFIDTRSDTNFTPLMFTIANEYIECAEFLIEQGAALALCNKNGENALHYAASIGSVKAIELLVKHRAQIDVKNNSEIVHNSVHRGGYTPLHFAVYQGHVDTTKKLVELGANIREKTTLGKTALDLAHDSGHKKVSEYLAERMASDKN
jgi:ankyrin repeat protein